MTYARRDPRVARGIRRVRLERCWTLRDVALLLGRDPSQISRIENGERGTPDPAEMAAKLGVPLRYLIAPCPRCGYQPPPGYLCLRCGTQATNQAGSHPPRTARTATSSRAA
jgi:transcriptional regulator with XRE-family HTH domain